MRVETNEAKYPQVWTSNSDLCHNCHLHVDELTADSLT